MKMDNLDLYNKIFLEVFMIKDNSLLNALSSESHEKWDSVNQLTLVTNIEDSFGVMLDPSDIIGFKSYQKGKEILLKYNIEL